MKKKIKKPKTDWQTLIISSILDLIVGLILILLDKII